MIFNFTCAAVAIVFAAQLATLAKWLSTMLRAGDDIARQIANAQIIFNILGVVLAIKFLPLIARGLEKLIFDKQKGDRQT
ncbi:hypothetical protein [Tolypothrix sp. NIES-4075]|uniref:hypothetical protein n=1 Tax=Tolypothrix sp. NIES-4075 TaxID=2005459 RepID=UPI001F445588|nr:hypothetical protein [Tolypothrix sp. NIES-4075]